MTNLGVSKLYLASLTPPLAKPGKGRLSLVAKAHLDNQTAMGNTFTDYPKATVPAKKKTKKTVKRNGKMVRRRLPKTGDKVFRNSNKVVEPTWERTFPSDARYFVRDNWLNNNRVEISEAVKCDICRYSVGWCQCGMPTCQAPGIVGNRRVEVTGPSGRIENVRIDHKSKD